MGAVISLLFPPILSWILQSLNVLASVSDTEVASCVLNHRKEIADISGKDCCFIYFRDLNKAKLFEEFQFFEYAERVYSFVRFLGIKYDILPCIVFFEHIDSGKYACVKLASLTEEQIILRLREIFSHMYTDKNPNLLKGLKNFQHVQAIQESKMPSRILCNGDSSQKGDER